MITVYIASPYSSGDVAQNVNVQLEMADELITRGYCPVVPLLYHFAHIHRPRAYEDWMAIDFEMVRRSDVLLRLPGDSKGADREEELAQRNRIPVVYRIDDIPAALEHASVSRAHCPTCGVECDIGGSDETHYFMPRRYA